MRDKHYYHARYKKAKSKFKRRVIRERFLSTLNLLTFTLKDGDFVYCQYRDMIQVKLPKNKVRTVQETLKWNKENEESEEIEVTRVILSTEPSCSICYEQYNIGEKIAFSRNRQCQTTSIMLAL